MASLNRVMLIGNLTRDPELRYTPQGTAVADLRLAVTTVRGRSGTSERKEETLFIDCTVWDRQAENCSEYLSKGRPVLVEGRLIEDQWQDKETGERRSRIKVYVQNVQFLGSSRDSTSGSVSGRYDAAGGEARTSARRPPAAASGGGKPSGRASDAFDDDLAASGPAGDDIPF